jgi:putative flavoprotein involved in K+ transport
VVIGDIDGDKAQAVADSIGASARAIRVDVRDRASVRAAIGLAVADFGGLDVMFNNAGIAQVRPFLDITEEDFRAVMEINALGVLIGTQEAVRQMLAQGTGGSIINTASIAGKQGYEPLGHYSASKFAVVALTQTAARAFGKDRIRVNAICPGVVATDMWKTIDRGFQDNALTSRPQEAFETFAAGAVLGRPRRRRTWSASHASSLPRKAASPPGRASWPMAAWCLFDPHQNRREMMNDMSKLSPDQMVSTARFETTRWVDDLNAALAAKDALAASSLFATTSFWRDLIAFTWNLKTVENPEGIADMLTATLPHLDAVHFTIAQEPTEADGIITAWLSLETGHGRGEAVVRLREGKAWTFLTTLVELKGHEEHSGPTRIMGAEHGVVRGRKSWPERKADEAATLGITEQPYVLIIGGGQGGIALGARMRQLGVSHIVIDSHDRPGDQWRGRYKSLCLHDPVWYDHLPYLDFPKNWPVFAPKDKIGDWLEMYTKVMEVNYWSKTLACKAAFDEEAGRWSVTVIRDGKEITLHPTQLVLATGMSGKPNIPRIPGAETFLGEQHHSSKHPGPDAYAGKKVVVIGANNSAHDICAALWEAGADVTMVQRSSTHILRSDTMTEEVLGDLYSERALANGVTTRMADLTFASIPYKVMPEFHIPLYERIQRKDAAFYDALRKAGFMLDFGADGSGLFLKYLRRGSGYYIDVGASDLVIDGSIKLKSGVEIDCITQTGVRFADGSELPADLIVYATGYGSMNGWAADLISQDVADKVGKVWGLGSDTPKDPGPWEGEERNMWKPTQQQNLWFHGGNLHQSRHYSLYLALQLKARMEGIPTPVYGLQQVHHLS